jgi:hypothetical protein
MAESYHPYVYTYPDGREILISIYLDAQQILAVDYAERPDRWATWGPPTRLEAAND